LVAAEVALDRGWTWDGLAALTDPDVERIVL
jgi:hypothetical protein